MSHHIARFKARAKSIHSDLRDLTQTPAQGPDPETSQSSKTHAIAKISVEAAQRRALNRKPVSPPQAPQYYDHNHQSGFYEKLNGLGHTMPTAEYPRPDFQRTNLVWESLNGPWNFLFDDEDVGLEQGLYRTGLRGRTGKNMSRSIEVPYVFQCAASGINEHGVHEVLWYERTIEDIRPQDNTNDRLLLRFGAVDYHARVWIDGQFVGEHRGGHVPFDLDISDAMNFDGTGGPKRLTVRVFDSAHDLTQPRGKQYWGPKPEDIFYTPSSGIWQSVWLESVPRLRIADSSHGTIIRSNNIDEGIIDARIAVLGRRTQEACYIELEVSLAGLKVSSSGRKDILPHEDFTRFKHSMRLSPDQLSQLPQPIQSQTHNSVALWSPEQPTLYDLTINLYSSSNQLLDSITTTTGMRNLNWHTGDSTFRLNNQPYFHALLLDQGYWPSTLMTPPSPASESCKRDIELSKAMGFNGCRKHQKVEDPLFLYWADRLGFMVWGEMAAAYTFSVDYVDRFNQEWMEMVKRDINHPCVVAWTPANESWGYPNLDGDVRQREHLRSLYHMTKTLDPTRPINDNCGWEHVVTDLSTFHDYADAKGMGERCDSVSSILGRGKNMFLGSIHGSGGAQDEGSKHLRGAPILCTEFGGVNIAGSSSKGGGEGRKENWGYTTAKDSTDLLKRIEGIVMATVKNGHVCGIVWTQTTDIEQEQNGLYTWDRREKLPAQGVREVIEMARATYLDRRR